MGLFDKLFPKPKVIVDNGYWKTLTAYSPVYRTRVGSAYESELVRAAIDTRARHIGKLNIDIRGTAERGLVSKLRRKPNEFMTWYKFFYRLSTILDMQNTAFIVPVYDDFGRMSGIYPILPSQVELVSRKSDNEPFIRYKFANGESGAVELKLCGIMTKFQYADDVFGASPDALTDTLDLIHLQKQGIGEAIKSSASYRFMARVGNFSLDKDLAKEKERFNNLNFSKDAQGGGFLLIPSTYTDVQQIKSTPYTIDSTQMSLIQTNVFNYFGVNTEVIQNKALGDELDAFFNGAIEPFAIQLSEVLTQMIYTPTEQDRGNEIIVTANRLQYMSVTKKISMVQQLGDRGMITIDEARELFNYAPLPDGAGQHAPIRGEYYSAGTKLDDDDNDNQPKNEEDEENATEE